MRRTMARGISQGILDACSHPIRQAGRNAPRGALAAEQQLVICRAVELAFVLNERGMVKDAAALGALEAFLVEDLGAPFYGHRAMCRDVHQAPRTRRQHCLLAINRAPCRQAGWGSGGR